MFIANDSHISDIKFMLLNHDILFSIDQDGGEILVLLDLSSAFDTIDHAVLFDLWHDTFGISGTALSLLKSYLHDRTQCVQINGIIFENAKLILYLFYLKWFMYAFHVLFISH